MTSRSSATAGSLQSTVPELTENALNVEFSPHASRFAVVTGSLVNLEEPRDPIFGCLGGSTLPFDVVLSVSEDGGLSFERVGVVAQTHFAQSLSYTYDLQVLGDGDAIYLVCESAQHGATVFRRALRISSAR